MLKTNIEEIDNYSQITKSHIVCGTYTILGNDNIKIKENSVVVTFYNNIQEVGLCENEIEIHGDIIRDIISKFGKDV